MFLFQDRNIDLQHGTLGPFILFQAINMLLFNMGLSIIETCTNCHNSGFSFLLSFFMI